MKSTEFLRDHQIIPTASSQSCKVSVVRTEFSDKKRHAVIRKAMTPGFSHGALKELEPTIHEHLQSFIKSLKIVASRNTGLVDMTEWFNNLMFSVLC